VITRGCPTGLGSKRSRKGVSSPGDKNERLEVSNLVKEKAITVIKLIRISKIFFN
jgi:hypothetical protein